MRRYILDARTATNHFPGIGRYVSSLAGEIGALLGTDEQLLILYDGSQPSRWPMPGATGRVALQNAPVSPFSLGQQRAIPRLLRRLEADIYHSPYYLMPYRPGLPTIVTIYDFIPQLIPHLVSSRARLLFRLTTRLALRAADQVITISAATHRDLLRLYPVEPQQVTTIPLAADSRFRPQSAQETGRVRRRYALGENYVLYFGINKPHKNLVRLVEAWSLVLRHVPDPPDLVIAGAWDERYPQVKERVVELKIEEDVRFLGPLPEADVPGLYAGALLFVFPSLYEGFGLPVVEAMACGTPVVCARASSLPEVAGDAAALVDATRPEAIAETLVALINDPAARETRQAPSLAQAAHFSWRKTAGETLALYRKMAT